MICGCTHGAQQSPSFRVLARRLEFHRPNTVCGIYKEIASLNFPASVKDDVPAVAGVSRTCACLRGGDSDCIRGLRGDLSDSVLSRHEQSIKAEAFSETKHNTAWLRACVFRFCSCHIPFSLTRVLANLYRAQR